MLRQLILPKLSARVLEMRLAKPPVQTTAQGLYQPEYEGRERQKWSALARKILAALGDYDVAVQALLADLSELASDPDLDEDDRRRQARALNVRIRMFDTTEGQELMSLVLESDEFAFLDSHWWALQLPSDRESRAILDPIDAALEPYNAISNPGGWREVKIDGDHVVPVAPSESARPKASNGKTNLRPLARR